VSAGDLNVKAAGRAVQEAEALLICAGAGMGVDSGLPDFRGREGFWRAYPVIARLGLSFEEMANPRWFARDPHLAWAFYGHRLNLYRATKPHAGFALLRQWAERMPAGWFVFTSNVDGQFQRAGFDPQRILECHGSIHHWQCMTPCCGTIWEAGDTPLVVDEETFRTQDPLPHCPRCGAVARPNLLMFGDGSWLPERTEAQEARLSAWLDDLEGNRPRLLVVEIGAGMAIPTVRHFSENMAQRFNGRLVRINPREPEVPEGQIGLAMGATEAMAMIMGE
jgi:NAD-dependent SIR2 family protein deacetylase